jgi:hypothetical protein
MSVIHEKDEHTLRYRDLLSSVSPNQPNPDPSWPFSVQSTEPQGWRLVTEGPGRLMWRYLPTEEERNDVAQTPGAQYFLGLPTVCIISYRTLRIDTETVQQGSPRLEKPTRPSQAAYNATKFFSHLQTKNGCWGTDMSCIFFVTPMLIMAWYIIGAEIPEAHAIALVDYAFAIQNEDGGWPTYTYGGQSTTLMGTILMYVALRLMGFRASHERMIRARKSLLGMGGAVLFWVFINGRVVTLILLRCGEFFFTLALLILDTLSNSVKGCCLVGYLSTHGDGTVFPDRRTYAWPTSGRKNLPSRQTLYSIEFGRRSLQILSHPLTLHPRGE